MKNGKSNMVTAGIPSLFLIFSVLVMVILALLTFGTSRSDAKMSRESLDRTTAYYETTAAAADLFNEIRSRTLSGSGLPSQEELTELAAGYENVITIEKKPDGDALLYEISFSDSQCLHVEISEGSPSGDGGLHIDVWDTRSIGSWNPDTTQHLFQGTIMED